MMRKLSRLTVACGLCLAAACLFAASALASPPQWRLSVTPNADYFLSGVAEQDGVYKIEAENVGTSPTNNAEPITIKDVLPAGVTALKTQLYASTLNWEDAAPFGLCPTLTECRYPEGPSAGLIPPLPPGGRLIMAILVEVPSNVTGLLEDSATISGGGAAGTVQASATNQASPKPPFGMLGFASSLSDSTSQPYTQAGGHPYQFVTEFDLETFSYAHETFEEGWARSSTAPVRDAKEIQADLPPGLIANPQAVPHCALADFYAQECKLSAAVGTIGLRLFGWTEGALRVVEPVYNLQPTGAYPGELGVTVGGLPLILITAGVRTDGDYGIDSVSVATEAGLTRVRLTLWGIPAESSHNKSRGKECSKQAFIGAERFSSIETIEKGCESEPGQNGNGGPAGVPPTPFLTMPTSCPGSPLSIVGSYNTWQAPGEFASTEDEFPAVDGCNQLSFEPTIEARPTTNLADAPSGLEFKLHIPQHEEPEALATPELKEAVVRFPAGLSVNPSSGAGLQGCSEAQVGLHSEEPAHCPDAAKLGAVKIDTQVLAEPLTGSLYLATPHQNPFGSLLAGYIVVEGQGVKIKLAGRFETDRETGQITARFDENPQLPFEDLELKLFGGARGALRTPSICGSYEVHSVFTPYSYPESGPPAEPGSEFETEFGPGGEGSFCPSASAAEEPNAPLLRAGAESPQAGAYSPYALKLTREDGSQEISRIETDPPPGLLGRLAGVPYCPDSALAAAALRSGAQEQANPSCPASEVGTVDVAAGAGPTPLHVSGRAYLAGPYKGAPISLAIITPAVAGPFDLGTVVVRVALYVDPETARIHAVSDQIPTILEGIPLDIRSVTVNMNRPNFALNPTNCEEMATTGNAFSILGAAAPLFARFQVAGCPALGFKPKLTLAFKGGTKRTKHPALKTVLTYPKQGSYANIARAAVTLPGSEIIDQNHIGNPCTRPQFAEDKCPKISVLGRAKGWSPLLDQPLEGKVYFRANGGERNLPDVVVDLRGQIHVVLVGAVDTVTPKTNARIRTTFFAVPDAPVSKFELELKGGKEGLLVNSLPLCKSSNKAVVEFTGQNGKTYEATPAVANSCDRKKGKKHGKGHRPSHRVGTSHR